MIFYLTFRLVSAVVAFLYPGYASYKTLSQRPASEADIERWLMYWAVMGCIVAMESAEWTISWLPLYYPIKTVFLLYLALPQTQGSSYLYMQHVQPFFHKHEHQIDATLLSLKSRFYVYLQELLHKLWGHVAASIGQQQAQQSSILNEDTTANRGAPPNTTDPASGPTQLISTFWSSFGPGIIASGAGLLRQAQAAAAAASAANASSQTTNPPAPSRSNTNQSILERRRQLEAELAALSVQPYDIGGPAAMPIPSASPAYAHPSRTPSEEDGGPGLRERTTSTSKFEEVEVPSDAEGSDEQGYARPSSSTKNTTWFGWGSGGGSYERVKSD